MPPHRSVDFTVRGCTLFLGLLFAGCGYNEGNAENCRRLARSIEVNHAKYSNEILFLDSRMNRLPEAARNSLRSSYVR